MLSFEQLKNPPAKVIHIPELGGEIKVKSLGVDVLKSLEAEFDLTSNDGATSYTAKFLSLALVDEAGNNYVTEEGAKQLPPMTIKLLSEAINDAWMPKKASAS